MSYWSTDDVLGLVHSTNGNTSMDIGCLVASGSRGPEDVSWMTLAESRVQWQPPVSSLQVTRDLFVQLAMSCFALSVGLHATFCVPAVGH